MKNITGNILIIEDDLVISRELCLFLRNNGYQSLALSDDYGRLQAIILENHIDLVLLDINLNSLHTDGFALCNEIRSFSSVPIIFVTSRSSDLDEIRGMMLGGDDYIAKPYNIAILLLRINALLKRTKVSEDKELITYKEITLSLARSTVNYKCKEIELTKNEMKILFYLFSHPNKVIDRGDIVEYLWNNQLYVDDNTLSLNVTRLRKKLSEIDIHDLIITKYGQGYRI